MSRLLMYCQKETNISTRVDGKLKTRFGKRETGLMQQ